MKIYLLGECHDSTKRLIKKMKLTCFILFVCVSGLFATNAESQVTKVSIDLRNGTVARVIDEIERQTDYLFVYNAEEIDLSQKVSISAKGKIVTEVLSAVFKESDITYAVEGSNILLMHKTIGPPQGNMINGKVTDKDKKPLPGVTITIVGSTRGVITAPDGTFSIDASPSDKLVFSFVGMESQIVDVGNRKTINITMAEKIDELSEVTIVAFGKQKKESVISSISTINAKDLKVPSSNLTTSFAGRIAGMISYQRSGEPGKDDAEFFVRGVTTFGTGKANPLILIDGVEMSSTDLAHLTPDDIGSFSIMKDANATALYGARGANGVILVNTKEGAEGKTKLSFRAETSLSSPTRMVDVADPLTFMRLRNEAVHARNPLAALPYTKERIDLTSKGTEPLLYPQVDWYDMLFEDRTINERYNVNISGGGKMARYYVAGAYSIDRGILKNDGANNFENNINIKRYSLRSNINMKFTPTTDAVIRLHGDMDKRVGPLEDGADYFDQARNASPVDFPAYYPKDPEDPKTYYANHILFGSDPQMELVNPYANMVKGFRESSSSIMLAQIELSQKLDFITKGLSARTLFNINRQSYYDFSRSTTPFLYSMSKNVVTGEKELTNLNPKLGKSFLEYSPGESTVSSSMYSETALTYNRTFSEKHDVSGIFVFTARDTQYGNADDLISSLPFRNLTFASRLTYGYDNKYFAEANFGYWGSERFAKQERWGFFPSMGLGWMVSNENFMKVYEKTITKLKLKGTYGLTGNDQIGETSDRFFYMSRVNMNDGNRASQFGTSLGYSRNGTSFTRYADPNITWEVSRKLNLGVELGLFNDFDIQFDYFKERRSNILQRRSDIPSTMGLQSIPSSNIGEAKSHGIELSIDYSHFFNEDLWINARGTLTYAANEYSRYEEPDYAIRNVAWLSHLGRSLSQPFGWVAERLFIDEEDVRNAPEQTFGTYGPGDIKYKDINRDGVISMLDQVPIGLPTSPELIYGFGFSLGFHQFDFSCFFQGSANSSFFIDPRATAPFAGGTRAILKAYADDHWSEENQYPYALWPRLSPEILENNSVTSTWWLRDGRFLRMKSAELGYSLSNKFTKSLKLENARIYVSGTNLFLISSFKLWDVEMAGKGLGYPLQRVINAGLKLDF